MIIELIFVTVIYDKIALIWFKKLILYPSITVESLQ